MSRLLNQAFPIVAAALGNRLGVRVLVNGSSAKTDGELIIVPAYDGDDPGYREVAWGYLAHEAAHVRYTDFNVFQEASSSPIRKAILNILEDVRIEHCLTETYPGTRMTIEKTVAQLIVQGGYASPPPDVHPAALLQAFLLFHLRVQILGQTALKTLAKEAGDRLERLWPAATITRLHGLIADVACLKDSRAALKRVDQIIQMLEEDLESPKPSDGEESPSKPDDSQTNSSDSRQEPRQDPGKWETGSETNGEPDPNVDATSAGGGTPAQPCESDPPVQDSPIQHLLEASPNDLMPDVFELAREGLRLDRDAQRGISLPAPDEPPQNPNRGAALMRKAVGESGKLRASLQGLVQASQLTRPVSKRTGNRVDSRRLTRIALGDARVFARWDAKKAPNTAVHLLVDRSPSMSGVVVHGEAPIGRRIDLAWEAAIALSLALESIPGVNPGVTAFPGQQGSSTSVYRILPHCVKVRQRTAAFGCGIDGSTPLAEGLWYSASQLLACREPRKIILALTDGIPDDLPAAHDVLDRCAVSEIEVIGIGLAIDVSRVFDRAITIQHLHELRSRLFALCRDLLMAA